MLPTQPLSIYQKLTPSRLLVVASVTLLLMLGLTARPVSADTIVIPCFGGGLKELLLQQAITSANTQPGQDTISLAKDCTFTFTESVVIRDGGNGLPLITDDLIIEGSDNTIIERGSAGVGRFRLLYAAAGVDLTLKNLTFQNGKLAGLSPQHGGAIYAGGSLTMTHVTVLSNTLKEGNGAGVYVVGDLVANHITATNNLADCNCNDHRAGHGGGIYVEKNAAISRAKFSQNKVERSGAGLYVRGRLTLTDSDFSRNQGGRALHTEARATLNKTTFTANQGGGAALDNGGAVLDSTFTQNIAGFGGGLYNLEGTVVIENSRFIGNQALNIIDTTALGSGGGGVLAFQARINNSRFENNSSPHLDGGGVWAMVDVSVQNSVFINNSARSGGGLYTVHLNGGIFSASSLLLNNLWLDNNAGQGAAFFLISPLLATANLEGGIAEATHNTISHTGPGNGEAISVGGGTAIVRNNIITDYAAGVANRGGSSEPDYNLLFGNGINYFGLTMGPNDRVADPRFMDAANHDFHLQPGSPAIDSALALGISVDLDGRSRPQGAGPDRGAFEHIAASGPGPRGTHQLYLPLVVK